MKTRLIFSLACMVVLISSAMAGTESNTYTPAGKLLENRIIYPGNAEVNGETGYVTFEISLKENNSVEFHQLATDNLLISRNVEKQLKRLESKLAKVLKPGETQKFRVVFKLVNL